jgi:hypothetical protein
MHLMQPTRTRPARRSRPGTFPARSRSRHNNRAAGTAPKNGPAPAPAGPGTWQATSAAPRAWGDLPITVAPAIQSYAVH